MLRILLPALILSASAYAADTQQLKLVEAAKAQVGITLLYDSRYQKITYPGGDIPLERGVCTDVVIRAYRKLGADLQLLVHRDMVKAWDAYPRSWSNKSPDSNIDHRRVPNLATFFRRNGKTLTIGKDLQAYQPGDIVTWRLSSGVPHIGLVSDLLSGSGVPLVIHNIGWGTVVEDRLFDFEITGHYRYSPKI
jgi:uncharacterized protein YijF (DUF1287 family)